MGYGISRTPSTGILRHHRTPHENPDRGVFSGSFWDWLTPFDVTKWERIFHNPLKKRNPFREFALGKGILEFRCGTEVGLESSKNYKNFK